MIVEKTSRSKYVFSDMKVGSIFILPQSNLIYFKSLRGSAVNITDTSILLALPYNFSSDREVIPIRIESMRYSEL